MVSHLGNQDNKQILRVKPAKVQQLKNAMRENVLIQVLIFNLYCKTYQIDTKDVNIFQFIVNIPSGAIAVKFVTQVIVIGQSKFIQNTEAKIVRKALLKSVTQTLVLVRYHFQHILHFLTYLKILIFIKVYNSSGLQMVALD